ncbi:uncharacterized protein LOC105924886 [Fundulus heteroclitus]|uniref:uncharacterized protein LOC105924886 n=1 Tax=Fundulus heteroclitus TaxID=8078 RepID=UPI00165C74C1|nr:uncharacterized protein LOC105924886 [Fundulus heteroclitus]
MCSTSCYGTESPAAIIWYQNSEFLYEDWSPWYQELVTSDPAVRYSCAIKGYEDIRAPEVSVDSVTRSCFSVTYAGGTMCSYSQTSEEQPCSITFPTELYVETKDSAPDHFKMICNSSCSQTDFQVLQLYRNTQDGLQKADQTTVFTSSSIEIFFCSVKNPDYLLSDQVCLNGSNCWTVNYVSRRICGLKGSSVNISSKYSLPENMQVQAKRWYKMKRNAKQEVEQLVEDKGDVKYQDNMGNKHILRLNNLDPKDSGEYKFRVELKDYDLEKYVYPGVTLIVTELRVDLRPAAEVTEGQRVTLTCSTSCPLSENTKYIWYLNSQPLRLTKTHNKQLTIDAVSSQDEGNYSCAVETISSAAKTLTVQRRTANWGAAAAGASAALLVFIPLIVFMIWKYKTSHQSSTNESVNNTDEINLGHTYEEISTHPAEKELHYSQLAIEKSNPLYSSIQQHQEQEHTPYAEVKIGTNSNSD